MASAHLPLLFLILSFLFLLVTGNPNPSSLSASQEEELDREGLDPFSILNVDSISHDYSPPAPPPPSPFVLPPSSCEEDLGGFGSFDTLCELNSSLKLSTDLYIEGKGSLSILPAVSLTCPLAGCFIAANLSGSVHLGNRSAIVAGRVYLVVSNMSLAEDSVVDTTALAGDPPPQTSGSPMGTNGDGGGHGGRGASCVVKEGQTPEDSWGGDAYSWDTLTKPVSYGSRGGTTSREKDYGGGGGGRIWLNVADVLEVDGVISADGGDAGRNGGGGSGGSIYIVASKM